MARREIDCPLLYWVDIKNIIDSDRLELLGRSKEQQYVYDNFRKSLSLEWQSMRDYLMVSKFNFTSMESEDGKMKAVREITDSRDCNDKSNTSQLALHLNDFSYNFEPGVKHYILWKFSNEQVTTTEINEAISNLTRDLPTAVDSASYVNPLALQSIPEIYHAHILLYCTQSV